MTTVPQQYILTTQDHLMLLIPWQDFHTARLIKYIMALQCHWP